MSRIETRLNRLEKIAGERGACRCGPRGKPDSVVYYPDEGQPQPSAICPTCGGKRIIFAIVYETQWPNHRAGEPRSFERFRQPAGYE